MEVDDNDDLSNLALDYLCQIPDKDKRAMQRYFNGTRISAENIVKVETHIQNIKTICGIV